MKTYILLLYNRFIITAVSFKVKDKVLLEIRYMNISYFTY